jgi:hypothetical protein
MVDTFTYQTPADESSAELMIRLAKVNNVYDSDVFLVQRRYCSVYSKWSMVIKGTTENIESFKKSAKNVVVPL